MHQFSVTPVLVLEVLGCNIKVLLVGAGMYFMCCLQVLEYKMEHYIKVLFTGTGT